MVVFSPVITPAKYNRNTDESYGSIVIEEYDDWSLDIDRASDCSRPRVIGDDMVRLDTFTGDFYIGDGHAHVDETMYKSVRLAIVREMVLRELFRLENQGCVDDLDITNRVEVRSAGPK